MAMPPQDDPHALAVEAGQKLEKLATKLSQMGVDPGVIQTVSKMADVTAKIVMVLGKGQHATGDNQPADPNAATPPAGPDQGGTTQTQADVGPQGPPPAPVDQAAPAHRPTLDSAIAAHQAEVAKHSAQPAR